MSPEKLPAKLMHMDEMGYSKDVPVLAYEWCPAGLKYLEPIYVYGYHPQSHETHNSLGNFREPSSVELVAYRVQWASMLRQMESLCSR